jgi:hypothetical protein
MGILESLILIFDITDSPNAIIGSMAILRPASPTPSNPDNELILAVNNGDLEALQDAVKRFGFRDEESVLRFALAVLSKSATRSLTITGIDGVRTTLNPSQDLLKQPEAVMKS